MDDLSGHALDLYHTKTHLYFTDTHTHTVCVSYTGCEPQNYLIIKHTQSCLVLDWKKRVSSPLHQQCVLTTTGLWVVRGQNPVKSLCGCYGNDGSVSSIFFRGFGEGGLYFLVLQPRERCVEMSHANRHWDGPLLIFEPVCPAQHCPVLVSYTTRQ